MYAYVGGDPVNRNDPSGKYDVSSSIAMMNECGLNDACQRDWVQRQPGEILGGAVAGAAAGAVVPTVIVYSPQITMATAVGAEAVAPGAGAATLAAGSAVVVSAQNIGFPSFAAFKSAFGPAGPKFHWHHVVEQTPGNLAHFGSHVIHSSTNIVRLDAKIHGKISGYYSSIQPFTNGVNVRKWLSTKSFDEQKTFGQDILRRFGGES
jgi:hypothetical protein